MDTTQVLDFINKLLREKGEKSLKDTEEIILREVWQNPQKQYLAIANEQGYTERALTQIASQLWLRLSRVFGVEIKKNKIRLVIEEYQRKQCETLIPAENIVDSIISQHSNTSFEKNSVEPSHKIQNFIGYDDNWVGRDNLIQNLKEKIITSKIVILWGITGIGKTALAEKLYKELSVQTDWNKLLRINFDNQDQSDFESFSTVANKWLKENNILVTPEDRQDISRLRKNLVDYISRNSCLVIIDSLEWILKENQEYGWSEFKDREWVHFLRLFLSQLHCQSRMIITTQHLPEDVSAGYDNFWFVQIVEGLKSQEQMELFRKIGVKISNQAELNYLERLGKVYEGHTLTLKTIAARIKAAYQGNLSAYWQEEGKEEIEKVEKDLELFQANMKEPWKLHNANHNLYHKVCYRLNKTLERLKKYNYYAYLLLCITSTYLRPHSKGDLLEHLTDEGCNQLQKKAALQALIDEQLIEKDLQNNIVLFRLHNLIRSVAYEHFKRLD